MRISIIVAVAKNGVIGRDNDLVWRLRDDMKFFADTTRGHTVITGRKNYESIPQRFRPLPERTNLVITRNSAYEAPGAHIVHSLDAALEMARKDGASEAFIIGGGQVYAQAMQRPDVDRLLITHVNAEPEGDTFFELKALPSGWNGCDLEGWAFEADDRNEYPFHITEYTRRS